MNHNNICVQDTGGVRLRLSLGVASGECATEKSYGNYSSGSGGSPYQLYQSLQNLCTSYRGNEAEAIHRFTLGVASGEGAHGRNSEPPAAGLAHIPDQQHPTVHQRPVR